MRTLHRATAAVLLLTPLAACTDAPDPLAPASGAPATVHAYEFLDQDGRRHLLRKSWSGDRLTEERHLVDGALFSIVRTTYLEDGTEGRTSLTVFSGGQVLEVPDVAALAPAGFRLSPQEHGPALGRLTLPAAPSYAESTARRCGMPIAYLATSSGVFAFAIFKRSPAGIVAAAEAYLRVLERIRKCFGGTDKD